MIEEATLRAALAVTLDGFDLSAIGESFKGKVRDNAANAAGQRVLVTSDRVSAFDRVLGTIPLKGQVLNSLTAWWFEHTAMQVPNAMISCPDASVMVAWQCEPLPVEIVVRAYLTGVTSTSIWTAYSRGERQFCGHALPDGLVKNDRLPAPIVTPSTKAAEGGHDVSVSGAALVSQGVLSRAEYDTITAMALNLFAMGAAHCAQQGLILVDTKYEFGRLPASRGGGLVVIDEVHTPDSSRFWFAESYEARHGRGEEPENFDKEFLRRWLVSQGYSGDGPAPVLSDEVRVEAARRYVEAYEKITGTAFVADLRAPVERVRTSLRTAGFEV